jgi:hypothetical protein
MRVFPVIIVLLIFIITPKNCFPQRKYLVASFWGLPSGSVGYGNLGFEYHAKNNADAWQFSINMAGGAIATDIGTTNRKWITADKLRSFKKSFHEKYSFFYSLFTEIGERKVTGGMWRNFQDTILNKKEAFEVNPGIGLGTNIQLFKKIHLQLIGAPKAIIAFHKDKYYDLINKNYFYKKFTDSNFGFRIAANFCFRL